MAKLPPPRASAVALHCDSSNYPITKLPTPTASVNSGRLFAISKVTIRGQVERRKKQSPKLWASVEVWVGKIKLPPSSVKLLLSKFMRPSQGRNSFVTITDYYVLCSWQLALQLIPGSTADLHYCYSYYYLWKLALQNWERVFTFYQSEDPKPTKPSKRRKEEKEKMENKKGVSSSGRQRSIDPALKTRQSHKVVPWRTIVNNVVPLIVTLSGRIGKEVGCLACCGCTFESSWGCTDLFYARGAQGVLPMKVGVRPVNWIYRLSRHGQ